MMFSHFLVSRFIKNHENIKDDKVRDSYGYLGGIVGIIINILLATVKLLVGLVTNSIAITADAVNNYSDVASSVITIAGFKLSKKPADREHPFGHGRIEYLSAMLVSFMVLLIGFQFTKTSFERILHPEVVRFELIPFLLILISVGTKVWLSRFNKFIGKKIKSSAFLASSFDALSDVFISGGTAISLVVSRYTSFPLDGYIGFLVSLFILYSGYSLIKETLDPLLGQAPDPILVEKITQEILSYEYITGVHDLIIHDYGPGRIMASIHVEVPSDISIVKIHNIIDKAEKELSQKHNIFLVIHMDPIITDSAEITAAKCETEKILKNFDIVKSIHDFRVVGEGEHKNLIFDVVVDSTNHLSPRDEERLKDDIDREIKTYHPQFNSVITVDKDFNAL